MKNRALSGFLKHLDFAILDFICLQVCFLVSYWLRFGFGNPFVEETYLFENLVLISSQLLLILFSDNYKNILKRKSFDELLSVLKHIGAVLVITVLVLYFTHNAFYVARLQVIYAVLMFIPLSYLARQLNKRRLYRKDKNNPTEGKRSIALVTSSELLEKAMENLTDKNRYHDYFISYVFLLDDKADSYSNKYEVPVLNFSDDPVDKISHEWVDEVLIIQPDYMPSPTDFMESVYDMGITLNYTMSLLNEEYLSEVDMQKIGKYKVFTSNLRFATVGELLLKRLMDIAGGIVGCLITIIIFIFVAPAIYIKSPGPIFFSHDRVGKNGRIFKMYKFRSMYLDAEERKQALMEQNKHKDGLMFKMDDDPRIIGSEKKDKNGKPKGIGNFIRNTSLDEFPQFWNVLKGDMSLVGTRPPTVDEWNKYNATHRVRLSVKPGITGMWQVSGRSEITDFDEVVALDREYLENWSLALDIRIILKTVLVVLLRKGSM